MEKSENGYPRRSTPNATDLPNGVRGGAMGETDKGVMPKRNCEGQIEGSMKCTDCLSDKPLAYSYTPIQKWEMLYTPEAGMHRGTLFEALDMPMEVYGHE